MLVPTAICQCFHYFELYMVPVALFFFFARLAAVASATTLAFFGATFLLCSYHGQASIVYNGMAEHGGRYEDIEIDRQACLYNDLFGWARIAVVALMSRPAPDVLSGPSAEGTPKIRRRNRAVVVVGALGIMRTFMRTR